MPSFDVVIQTDLQEVDNALNQARKEIAQRFDFRGSKSRIDWDRKGDVTLVSDDRPRLDALLDVVKTKLVRRGVSIKNLEVGESEPAADGLVRQKVTLKTGIPKEAAKEICQHLRQSKIKVQGQIQDEQIRVTGKKRDDLQAAIASLKEADFGLDVLYQNFRQ